MSLRFGRLFLAVVAAAGLGGCGSSMMTPLPVAGSGPAGELILADSATAAHFSLSMVNGTPTLTGMGSAGTVSAAAGLVDSVTGQRYSMAVNGGALMLVPAAGLGGAAGIELRDTVTAKAYTLTAVRGALMVSLG